MSPSLNQNAGRLSGCFRAPIVNRPRNVAPHQPDEGAGGSETLDARWGKLLDALALKLGSADPVGAAGSAGVPLSGARNCQSALASICRIRSRDVEFLADLLQGVLVLAADLKSDAWSRPLAGNDGFRAGASLVSEDMPPRLAAWQAGCLLHKKRYNA